MCDSACARTGKATNNAMAIAVFVIQDFIDRLLEFGQFASIQHTKWASGFMMG